MYYHNYRQVFDLLAVSHIDRYDYLYQFQQKQSYIFYQILDINILLLEKSGITLRSILDLVFFQLILRNRINSYMDVLSVDRLIELKF